MALREIRKQTNSVSKRITALVTSAAVVLTGAIGVARIKVKTRQNNEILPEDSISTTLDETKPDDKLLKQLKLTENFDINDEKAVKKRAKAIYNLSEKKVSIELIEQVIYLLNDMYDKIDLTGEETEFKKLRKIFDAMVNILDDNIIDIRNKQIGEETGDSLYDNAIYSYMFMANDIKDNLITKSDAISFAKVIRKQLNNIKNEKTEKYNNVAEEYYKLYKQFESKESDNNKPGYTYVFWMDTSNKNVLMTPYLSKEKQKKLDENIVNTYDFSGEVITKLKINKEKDISIANEEGAFGYDVPNFGERYNSSDAKKANVIGGGNGNSSKKVVDEGGKPVGGYSEKINTPTTSVSTKTSVAEPSTKKDNTSTTTKPNKEETTTKNNITTSSSTQEVTAKVTTGKNEEVIEKGGEVVSEYYVDADLARDTVKTK